MSIIIPANSAAGGGGYAVDNSARFQTASLKRSAGSKTNATQATISMWFKRSELVDCVLMQSYTDDSNRAYIKLLGDTFYFFDRSGGTTENYWVSTFVLRDVSAFYHLHINIDTGNGTVANRFIVHLNGVNQPVANFTNNATYGSGVTSNWQQASGTNQFTIGANESVNDQYFGGYMSEVVYLDGQVVAYDSFGEFDEDSGIWKPIDVSGLTFGTNGFYLDFENSGALGADVSGNSNNFTVNNLTAIDQTTDTPTNNFATWNPLVKTSSTVTISEGNTIGTEATNGSYFGIVTTMFPTSGKWYGEMKFTSLGTVQTGFITEGTFIDGDRNLYSSSSSLYWQSGSTSISTVLNSSGVTTVVSGGSNSTSAFNSTNDIIMYAWDVDNGRAWFGINGTWQNSGNPAGPTNWWSLPSDYAAGVSLFTTLCGCGVGTATVNLNTGNPPFTGTDKTDGNSRGSFEYQPPDGFLSLCTANLSEFG